jgi:hypothetical protein
MIELGKVQPTEPMTLPTACQWLGQHTGRVPATSTMWRWCLKGVRGGTRLECFRVGGTTYVTPAAIRRFIERTSAATAVDVSPAGVSVRDEGQVVEHRAEQVAAAQRRLADICKPRKRGRRSR